MIRDDTSYMMKCYYTSSLKGLFESIGKITLDRMTFYMLFREKEMRLVVQDASGLSNSIVIGKELFEEVYINRNSSPDSGHLVKIDLKDFNSIHKFLVIESFLTIRYSEEKGKVYFCCEEENEKYKEVRKLKLKELKTQTQINLSASFPDEQDVIGEINFNSSGTQAFKVCIERTFSAKNKYLIFHFHTEKSTLMVTNEEIKEGEIEQYDFICHIFPNDAIKGKFHSTSDFKFHYSYKLLHYVTGFLVKDCSILVKVYSSGALSFSNIRNSHIEVSTIVPASRSENEQLI